MGQTLRYDYLKYQAEDSDETLIIVRCPAGCQFSFQRWDGEQWSNMSDSFDDIKERANWFPVSQQDALAALPRLTVRYKELEIEKQRQADLEEKRKIQNQRLDFTLRGLGGGWTELEKGTVALHNMYVSLFNAGFTKEQALKMATELLVHPNRDALPPLLPIQQSVN